MKRSLLFVLKTKRTFWPTQQNVPSQKSHFKIFQTNTCKLLWCIQLIHSGKLTVGVKDRFKKKKKGQMMKAGGQWMRVMRSRRTDIRVVSSYLKPLKAQMMGLMKYFTEQPQTSSEKQNGGKKINKKETRKKACN